MNKIIIVGGGGHAKVIVSILKKLQFFDIIGYTDFEDKGELLGVSFLGTDSILAEIINTIPLCAAGIGFGMINGETVLKRRKAFQLLKTLRFNIPPIVSPNAIINEDVKIGEGTVTMDGVVINTGTVIGQGVILNTCCSVDHDCEVGDYTHIAPGAVLAGGVKIGDNVLIGAGSVVCPNVIVAGQCVIGAGAVVAKNIDSAGTYAGIPAKKTNK